MATKRYEINKTGKLRELNAKRLNPTIPPATLSAAPKPIVDPVTKKSYAMGPGGTYQAYNANPPQATSSVGSTIVPKPSSTFTPWNALPVADQARYRSMAPKDQFIDQLTGQSIVSQGNGVYSTPGGSLTKDSWSMSDPSAQRPPRQGQITSSRESAIRGLIAQGIRDPDTINQYLGEAAQGSGFSGSDFSRKEIQRMLDSDPLYKQQSIYEQAATAYIDSLGENKAVSEARKRYQDYVAKRNQGLNDIEKDPVAMAYIIGDQQNLLKNTQNEAERLQGEIGIEQESAESLQNQANARYLFEQERFKTVSEREEERLKLQRESMKPMEVGGALVRQNPLTGAYETIYQSPDKPQEVGGNLVQYNPVTKQYETVYQGAKEPEVRSVGDSLVQYNAATGKWEETYRAPTVPGQLTTQQSSNLNSVTTKYQADDIVNNGLQVRQMNAIADQVIADPSNAGNQITGLYTLIKALDPTSAVREGELALAQQTQSYLSRFATSITRLGQGQTISPEAAVQLAQATKNLATLWQQAATRKTQQYQSQADVLGVGDLFQQYLGGFETPGDMGAEASNPASQFLNGVLQSNADPGGKISQLLQPGSPLKQQVLGLQQAGDSPEEILRFLKSEYGQKKNSSVSVSIPTSARLAKVNNNPGNLKFVGQAGAVRGEGGFAKFSTPEAGALALQQQIKLDAQRGHTIASLAEKYAPRGENNTNLWIQQVAQWAGVSPNTQLSAVPIGKLVAAIARKESSSNVRFA